MQLPIITVPNPKLRTHSKPVNLQDNKSLQFISDLGETLVKKTNPPGVGLSAIQVGVPLRAFFMLLPENYMGEDSPHSFKNLVPTAFINPKIVAVSPTLTLGPNPKKPLLEGCLSIPHLYGPVLRHTWIDLEYETITDTPGVARGNASSFSRSEIIPAVTKVVKRFTGFPARVIEHEYDHLDGILFTDHILHQKLNLYFDTGDRLQTVAQPTKLLTW